MSPAVDPDPRTSPSGGKMTSARLTLTILQKVYSPLTLICGEK